MEALRKYHPDKTTDEKLKARNTEITQAVVTAFTLLKTDRKMS
jgi:curved DNA-binding protein CbpA